MLNISLLGLLALLSATVECALARGMPGHGEAAFRALLLSQFQSGDESEPANLEGIYPANPKPAATSYRSSGYIVAGLFTDATCSSPMIAYGLPVNTCFIGGGYAYMYRLTEDSCAGAVIEYFTDKACTQLAGTSAPEVPSTCSEVGPGMYMTPICSASSQPKVFVESVVFGEYIGADCVGGGSYMAMPVGACGGPMMGGADGGQDDDDNGYAGEDDGASVDTAFSCAKGKVIVTAYARGSECSGSILARETIPDICLNTNYGDVGGMQSLRQRRPDAKMLHAAARIAENVANTLAATRQKRSSIGKTPSSAATAAAAGGEEQFHPEDAYYYDPGAAFEPPLNPPPSVSTTPFPTTPAELYPPYSQRISCQSPPSRRTAVFAATQTVEGVSLADVQANAEPYSRTFKQAVASVVTGATESSVSDLVVQNAAAAASVQATRRLAASPLQVSYKVSVPNTMLSTDTLSSQLRTAVSSGAFDTSLRSLAAANGAAGLLNATSTAVATQSLPDAGGDSSSDDALDTGAIVGIVIGCVAAVVLAAAAAWYFCLRHTADEKSTGRVAPLPAGNSTHGLAATTGAVVPQEEVREVGAAGAP